MAARMARMPVPWIRVPILRRPILRRVPIVPLALRTIELTEQRCIECASGRVGGASAGHTFCLQRLLLPGEFGFQHHGVRFVGSHLHMGQSSISVNAFVNNFHHLLKFGISDRTTGIPSLCASDRRQYARRSDHMMNVMLIGSTPHNEDIAYWTESE